MTEKTKEQEAVAWYAHTLSLSHFQFAQTFC